MEEKELKKLSRIELMEIIVEQSKKIDALNEEIEQYKAQLKARKLICEQAGNLADAALMINKVMEAAQQAADDYLANIKSQENHS